jgi:hypothetical protein
MRRVVSLVGFILFVAISAGAQGPTGVGSSPHGSSHTFSSPDFSTWQFSLDYQYNRINLLGAPFNTNGLNASVARYFGRRFGIEGQVGIGFGNTGATTTPANLNMKSLFVGGGPRLAFRNRGRFEPWLHFVIGMEHFRFTQTAGVLGNNTALAGAAGGGMDYLLRRNMAVRVEADFIGSRFFSTNQRHFQVVSGLVFNF